MSLNWDVTKCANPEELTSDKEWSTTQYIISLTMVLGMSGITKKNVDDFLVRMMVLNLLSAVPEAEHLKPEAVERYIGLSVNVMQETWHSFATRMMKTSQRELTNKLRAYREKRDVVGQPDSQ